MTFLNVTVMFLNTLFNKEYHILIKICICLKNTWHRSYRKSWNDWRFWRLL